MAGLQANSYFKFGNQLIKKYFKFGNQLIKKYFVYTNLIIIMFGIGIFLTHNMSL